jgi:hypothetical protein
MPGQDGNGRVPPLLLLGANSPSQYYHLSQYRSSSAAAPTGLAQGMDKASGLAYNTDLDISNIDTAKLQCPSFAGYIHLLS